MIYDNPLITYDGAPTDAYFNQLLAKVEATPLATVTALNATTIPTDVRKVNGDTIIGHGIPPTYDNTGTMTAPGDPWRPA